MRISKIFSRIAAVGGVAIALVASFAKVGQTVPELPFSTCVSTGPGIWRTDRAYVSVNRAVFRSLFHLAPANRSVEMTCRITPEEEAPRFQTLQLAFGMSDRDRNTPANTVNIYLDGQRIDSRTVSAGERVNASLDVSQARNVTLEAVCSSQVAYCGRVYVFQAALTPKSTTPANPASPSQP